MAVWISLLVSTGCWRRFAARFLFTPSFVASPFLPCVQFSSTSWIIYTLSQIHIGNTLWSLCILHKFFCILCDVHKIIELLVFEFVKVKMDFFYFITVQTTHKKLCNPCWVHRNRADCLQLSSNWSVQVLPPVNRESVSFQTQRFPTYSP